MVNVLMGIEIFIRFIVLNIFLWMIPFSGQLITVLFLFILKMKYGYGYLDVIHAILFKYLLTRGIYNVIQSILYKFGYVAGSIISPIYQFYKSPKSFIR